MYVTVFIIDYSDNQCCGSKMFIPDPNFSIPDPGSRVKNIPDPGSWSASKNLSNQQFFIPDPDLDYLPIPDPNSRGQKGTGFRIRIRNTADNDVLV
jgi:hypothetical protein